jgi:predicted nucleic acid-binding protein
MRFKIPKVNVYFDTNIIKKHNGKLTKFEINETYNRVKNFIEGNKLDSINFFIPEIVLEEIIEQYITEYKSLKESINNALDKLISNASRLDWNVEIINESKMKLAEYEDLIRTSVKDFFKKESSFISVIKHCKNDKMLKIINRAIRKKKPFFSGKSQKKNFSDAGFKDVVFLESILEHMESEDCDYIIISKDNLLSEINLNEELSDKSGKIIKHDTGEDIVSYLIDRYDIKDFSELVKRVESDYFREMIENSLKGQLIEINLDLDKQEIGESTDVFKSKCKIRLNDKDKIIWVTLSDAYDFVEIIDESTQEVMFEW